MKKYYLLLLFLWFFSLAFAQEAGDTAAVEDSEISSIQKKEVALLNNSIEGFSVYPNPVTTGSFKILSIKESLREIQIFDMLGKQVFKSQNRGNEDVIVNDLISGMYILKVEEENKTAIRKLVIE